MHYIYFGKSEDVKEKNDIIKQRSFMFKTQEQQTQVKKNKKQGVLLRGEEHNLLFCDKNSSDTIRK